MTMEQATLDLWALVVVSPRLEDRVGTDNVLGKGTFYGKAKATARQFRWPESLDLSSDSPAGKDAANLVEMALAGETPRPKRLDQSG